MTQMGYVTENPSLDQPGSPVDDWATFKAYQQQNPEISLTLKDLYIVFWLASLLTVIRYAYNGFSERLLSILSKRLQLSKDSQSQLAEEIWQTIISTIMLVYTGWVNLSSNPACITPPFSRCIDFPSPKVHPVIKQATLVLLSQYTHQLLKPILKVGHTQAGDMRIHHYITLVLLAAISYLNLGPLLLTFYLITAFSNPVLHTAKILHILGYQKQKKFAFFVFATTFFVCRIIVFPLMSIPSFRTARAIVRGNPLLTYVFVVVTIFILGILGLQIKWMMHIVSLVVKNGKGGQGADGGSSERVSDTVGDKLTPLLGKQSANTSPTIGGVSSNSSDISDTSSYDYSGSGKSVKIL